MGQPHETESDFGTGQKNLTVYSAGMVCCLVLTVLAFWLVMFSSLAKWQVFAMIYSAAIIQFIVQLVCFLRLNTQTEQAQTNVMSLLFTIVIMISIIIGSLWIMWNLSYHMM